jgi:alkanesulfonate monooxygenase SsuD/methylene tetrahydromethanopterin reductase-like flavin-dependent oxidoreductase (luciferase family)
MEFGMCVTTKLTDVDFVRRCEDLGFDMAWVPDSQMIWGDCFAYLALAAERTSRLRLGTGVAVAGIRSAPVIAHSIASVATLAPGRVWLGIGSGNSAYRFMDLKPLPSARYAEELRVIRALLAGDEVDFTFRGHTAPIRLLMGDRGFVELEHRVPMIVSGFGPKSQAVAGRYGDGLFVSMPVEERSIERSRETVRRAAREAGRSDLDVDGGGAAAAGSAAGRAPFPIVNLLNVVILDPGEDILSDRVVAEHGPFIVSSMHYLFEGVRQYQREPPRRLADVWDRYTAMIEKVPEQVRHLRIHEGHCTYLLDEERPLLTPELVRATTIVGSPEECREQIRRLEAAGVSQLVVLPALGHHEQYAERFAREIIDRY